MKPAFLLCGLMLLSMMTGCCMPVCHRDPGTGFVHGGGYFQVCRFAPFKYLKWRKEMRRYHKCVQGTGCGSCDPCGTCGPRAFQPSYHVSPAHPFTPYGSVGQPTSSQVYVGQEVIETPMNATPTPMTVPPAESAKPPAPGPPNTTSRTSTPPRYRELAPLPQNDARRPGTPSSLR